MNLEGNGAGRSETEAEVEEIGKEEAGIGDKTQEIAKTKVSNFGHRAGISKGGGKL